MSSCWCFFFFFPLPEVAGLSEAKEPGSAVYFVMSWAGAFLISFSLGFYFQLGASLSGQKWGKQTIN